MLIQQSNYKFMPDQILPLYGIQPATSNIELLTGGLINSTWKVTSNSKSYILQQVNQSVFKKPQDIDDNLFKIKLFLKENHPEYLFISPIADLKGRSLVKNSAGYFRIFPFVNGSHSLNVLCKKEEAFEAASQFGRFSRLLNNFDVTALHLTLPDFHNLDLRFRQFLSACDLATPERKEKAKDCISFILENKDIVIIYRKITTGKEIPLRVIHHDTKISNVLFDQHNKGICVIDLDTVMPGYFISDVGDMMRTYLSSAGEEETDFSKIDLRKDFFMAIHQGYMQEMGDVLTGKEKAYFSYAGRFIIYMQAIRFLTDYLENDIYYGEKYPGHNLNRAINQVVLLKKYLAIEDQLEEIVKTGFTQ